MEGIIPCGCAHDPMKAAMDARENKRQRVYKLAREVSMMNQEANVDQRIFAMEECTEVTMELMKYAQDLSKGLRGRIGESGDLIDEICDIFASSYILLIQRGVTENYILNQMIRKYERALDRYEKTGEI